MAKNDEEKKGGIQIYGTALFAAILRTYEKLLYLSTYFKNFQFFTFLRPDTLAGVNCFGAAAVVSLVLSILLPPKNSIPKYTYIYYLSGLYTILSYLIIYTLEISAPWIVALIYVGVSIISGAYWFTKKRMEDSKSTIEIKVFIDKFSEQLKSRLNLNHLISFVSLAVSMLLLNMLVGPMITVMAIYLVGLSIQLLRTHWNDQQDGKPDVPTSDKGDDEIKSSKSYFSRMWESICLFVSVYYLISHFLPALGLSIAAPSFITIILFSAIIVVSIMTSESLLSAQDSADQYMFDQQPEVKVEPEIRPPSVTAEALSESKINQESETMKLDKQAKRSENESDESINTIPSQPSEDFDGDNEIKKEPDSSSDKRGLETNGCDNDHHHPS